MVHAAWIFFETKEVMAYVGSNLKGTMSVICLGLLQKVVCLVYSDFGFSIDLISQLQLLQEKALLGDEEREIYGNLNAILMETILSKCHISICNNDGHW